MSKRFSSFQRLLRIPPHGAQRQARTTDHAGPTPECKVAQTHEKQNLAALLRSLCEAVESPSQYRGRPRIPLSDAIFSAVMKVYGTTFGRDAMTDMREHEALRLIDKMPSNNSILMLLRTSI